MLLLLFVCYVETWVCLNLFLKGIAKVVVDAVKQNEVNYSLYGHLVDEINMILQGFAAWKFQYVPSVLMQQLVFQQGGFIFYIVFFDLLSISINISSIVQADLLHA